MDSKELMAMMKSHSDAYLAAYKAGYEKGFTDACNKAVEITTLRKYTKRMKPTDAPGT